jgi:Protein of unknown function (DUF2827)
MTRRSNASATLPEKNGVYCVGITIFIRADGTLALYENGLRQNVVFLYHLFKNAPGCARVYLLNHGDGEPSEDVSDLSIDPADIVRTPAVMGRLDYVIGAGAAMDRQLVMTMRQRGCRFICYKGGNGAVISMEAIVARPPRPDAERYFDHDFYDAIWMTPQHIRTYRGWCETLYRCPVYEAPQIWSPLFVDRVTSATDRFGYRPGVRKWRVGVMDPNITVMKTSHLPMLVCELAYRQRPQAFEAMYITNAIQFRENPHFRSFTLSLQASKAGVMTAEPRFISADFLANHADAVVTHHWENGLNYLYYEVLYGGYPLIHNSEFLREYGYFYDDFDAEAGAVALLRAYQEHDEGLEDYRKRNHTLFRSLNPCTPSTIAIHERLLQQTLVCPEI